MSSTCVKIDDEHQVSVRYNKNDTHSSIVEKISTLSENKHY